MNTPKSIKNSTETNNGEEQISVEQFIIKNFVNSNDSKDRLLTETISSILNNNGYKIDVGDAGKLMNRIGIGKYNKIVILIDVKREVMKILKILVMFKI